MKEVFRIKTHYLSRSMEVSVLYSSVNERFYRLDLDGELVEMRRIKGFEGYWICADGIVVSAKTCRVLAERNVSGYNSVTLSNGSTRKEVSVHRLVAETFLDNPMNLPVVNHKDENKRNNRYTNLEWCTYRYNTLYSLNKEEAIKLGVDC